MLSSVALVSLFAALAGEEEVESVLWPMSAEAAAPPGDDGGKGFDPV